MRVSENLQPAFGLRLTDPTLLYWQVYTRLVSFNRLVSFIELFSFTGFVSFTVLVSFTLHVPLSWLDHVKGFLFEKYLVYKEKYDYLLFSGLLRKEKNSEYIRAILNSFPWWSLVNFKEAEFEFSSFCLFGNSGYFQASRKEDKYGPLEPATCFLEGNLAFSAARNSETWRFSHF